MEKDIYRVEVEVAPMEGAEMPADFIGAIVNVYMPAHNIREAIDLTEKQLLSDRYKTVETTAAFQLDLEGTDYDTDEEGYPGNKELYALLENGGYWYGPFNGWASAEDHELH